MSQVMLAITVTRNDEDHTVQAEIDAPTALSPLLHIQALLMATALLGEHATEIDQKLKDSIARVAVVDARFSHES